MTYKSDKEVINEFDELLSHFKQISETNNPNTALNNVRRRPNSELEQEIKAFITSLRATDREAMRKIVIHAESLSDAKLKLDNLNK